MKIHFFFHIFVANFEHFLFFSVFYVDCKHAFTSSADINLNTWDFGGLFW